MIGSNHSMDNQFNALCELASAEGWCWNLACTTCGHLHFRYGFLELASGKSVNDSDWIVHRRKTAYAKQLGTLPKNYSESQKESVLIICKDANIAEIALVCKFPDWLGFLGLVLVDMNPKNDRNFETLQDGLFFDVPQSNRYLEVSQSWASQLKNLVMADSSIWHQLDKISSNELTLTLENLESIESNLIMKTNQDQL